MKLIDTALEGVVIIIPDIYGDERGYFYESFNTKAFAQLIGRDITFVQDNESLSHEGVVRGLHYQLPPCAQSKLVRVVRGAILDIVVDIRRGSPTFGKYVAVELSAENHHQLFIPRGFAHGFKVVEGEAVVQYKCDSHYAPECEGTIRWDDPTLAIDWQMEPSEAVVSVRDRAAKLFEECGTLFDYNIDYYA
jgi:dTDP-4-dehydrorhamnose 3,5-epimerase